MSPHYKHGMASPLAIVMLIQFVDSMKVHIVTYFQAFDLILPTLIISLMVSFIFMD